MKFRILICWGNGSCGLRTGIEGKGREYRGIWNHTRMVLGISQITSEMWFKKKKNISIDIPLISSNTFGPYIELQKILEIDLTVDHSC